MRLLTWNLNGLDNDQLDDRTEAAVFLSVAGITLAQLTAGVPASLPPDVLVFQEVVERTFLAHLAPHLQRAGYKLYPKTPPDRQIFEVVAVLGHHSILRAHTSPLSRSVFGRELQSVDIATNDEAIGELSVLTAHFDSGAEQRENRLAQARQVMASMGPRAVFAGDTNMRTAEWDALRSTTMVTDAWETVGEPARLRRTWRSGTHGARFDRVWFGEGLVARALEGIGIDEVAGLNGPPSDHVGLRVTFDVA